jgi:hypothetical protein
MIVTLCVKEWEISIETLNGWSRSVLFLTDAPFLSSCVDSGGLGGRTMSEISYCAHSPVSHPTALITTVPRLRYLLPFQLTITTAFHPFCGRHGHKV